MAITTETLRLARELRLTISGIVDADTRALVRAWDRAWRGIAAEWDAAIAEIATSDQPPTFRQLTRMQRAENAVKASLDMIDDLVADHRVSLTNAAGEVVDATRTLEARQIASQLPRAAGTQAELAVRFDRVNVEALEVIVRRTTRRITSLTKPLSKEATEAMLRELTRAVPRGYSPREAARRMLRAVEGRFAGGLSRALTIARTEILDAYRAAAGAQQSANGDVLAGWVWLAQLDSNTCISCVSMHGSLHPIEESGPLGHQNCLVGGAVVEGPVAQASSTRWYAGEIIDIETVGGRTLSVTPNHPMLTTQGWVAAGLLHEGHDLVCGRGLQGPATDGHPDDHQVPSRIEDVAQTLGRSTPVLTVSVPTAAEDFHGDGLGSDVHVVRTDRFLGHGVKAALNEPAAQQQFVIRDMGAPDLSGGGDLRPMLGRLLGASSGRLCSEHQRLVLIGRSAGNDHPVGVGVRPQDHAAVHQPSLDRAARHAEALGDRVARLAEAVAPDDLVIGQRQLGHRPLGRGPLVALALRSQESSLIEDVPKPGPARVVPGRGDLAAFARDVVKDRVLNIGSRRWCGHVYNLQTATGWYIANGIVTHNCRCARMPKTMLWADLGYTAREPADRVRTGADWFGDQPEATQLRIAGPERLDALRSGRASMDDMTTRRSTPGWRDSYVPTPVAQFA